MESLTAEQQELLKLEIETLHESWLAVLKDEVRTPEFLALKRFLNQESKGTKKIFPPEEDIYSWSVPLLFGILNLGLFLFSLTLGKFQRKGVSFWLVSLKGDHGKTRNAKRLHKIRPLR